jgi:hypothetical protein
MKSEPLFRFRTLVNSQLLIAISEPDSAAIAYFAQPAAFGDSLEKRRTILSFALLILIVIAQQIPA